MPVHPIVLASGAAVMTAAVASALNVLRIPPATWTLGIVTALDRGVMETAACMVRNVDQQESAKGNANQIVTENNVEMMAATVRVEPANLEKRA